MHLEFIPVKEREGPRRFGRSRNSLRLYWIVSESAKAALSGGFTLGTAPL